MFYAFAVVCVTVTQCLLTPPTNRHDTEPPCIAEATRLAVPFRKQEEGAVFSGCVVRPDDWDGSDPVSVAKEIIIASRRPSI